MKNLCVFLLGVFLTCLVAACNKVSSAGPLDRQSAIRISETSILLPASAFNIYFHHIDGGSQQHDLFIRYEISSHNIKDEILKVIESQPNFTKSRDKVLVEPITSKKNILTRQTWFWKQSSPSWWRPQDIQTGLHFRVESKLGDQDLWIDEKNNTVYSYQFF